MGTRAGVAPVHGGHQHGAYDALVMRAGMDPNPCALYLATYSGKLMEEPLAPGRLHRVGEFSTFFESTTRHAHASMDLPGAVDPVQ
jgi:hypothetical protein